MRSLTSKIAIVNPQQKYNIDWKTLLKTIIQNFHALSHFKHDTFVPFNMLQTSVQYQRIH